MHRSLLALLALGSLAGMAGATSPAPPQPPPPGPRECIDTPAPDVKHLAADTLPVHRALAAHLLQSRKPSFSCESASFRYEGVAVSKDEIRVQSRHRKTGKLHAEVTYGKHYNIGSLRKHGEVQAFGPRGQKLFTEYHCFGFAVGFHSYYDATGKLAGVADHTNSDYRYETQPSGGHRVTRDRQTEQWQQFVQFREVFTVATTGRQRVEFGGNTIFGQHWRLLDPATAVRTWTAPGPQGTVRDPNRPQTTAELVNVPFEYQPFWELYVRKANGVPAPEPVPAYTREVLQCPWISQAMSLASTDSRFAFPSVPSSPGPDRVASRRTTYLRCLESPSAECLLDFAMERALEADSNRGTFLVGLAVASLAMKQPHWASEALADLRSTAGNYSEPNPYLAPWAALNAAAARQSGREADALQSAEQAVWQAGGTPAGYRSENLLRGTVSAAQVLAENGFVEHANRIRLQLLARNARHAEALLLPVALAYARAGASAPARALAGEQRRHAQVAPATATMPLTQQPDEMEFEFAARKRSYDDAIVRIGAGPNAQPAAAACAAARESAQRLREGDATVLTFSTAADAGVRLAQCDDTAGAITLVREALRLADAEPVCRGDMCWGFPGKARQEVVLKVIEARQLQLLEDGSVAGLSTSAKIAYAGGLARQGKPEQAQASLDAIRGIDGAPAAALATALLEIAVARGRTEAIATASRDALRTVTGLDRSTSRAEALMALGRVHANRNACTDALFVFGLGRSTLIQALAGKLAPIERNAHYHLLGELAVSYAQCGSPEEAQATLSILSAPFAVSWPAQSANDIDAIELEIALHDARAGNATEALQKIKTLRPSPARFAALAELDRAIGDIAAEKSAVAQLAAADFLLLEQYFLTAATSAERRALLGHAAHLVRSHRAAPWAPDALAQLTTLARSLEASAWRARALCDAGSAATALSDAGSTALFDEASRAMRAPRPVTFPLDPQPYGACAYWLREAGQVEQARAAENLLMVDLRRRATETAGILDRGDTGTLINLAIAFHEALKGELLVDWPLRGRP